VCPKGSEEKSSARGGVAQGLEHGVHFDGGPQNTAGQGKRLQGATATGRDPASHRPGSTAANPTLVDSLHPTLRSLTPPSPHGWLHGDHGVVRHRGAGMPVAVPAAPAAGRARDWEGLGWTDRVREALGQLGEAPEGAGGVREIERGGDGLMPDHWSPASCPHDLHVTTHSSTDCSAGVN
jgi:hypothetical protein